MYLSFEWLNDYLDLTGLTGEALADRMSRTGIEIEAVENYGAQLSGLVVGQVLSVEDHADSDGRRSGAPANCLWGTQCSSWR